MREEWKESVRERRSGERRERVREEWGGEGRKSRDESGKESWGSR